MKDMTEREILERKILLQQQVIPQLAGERNWMAVEKCRARICRLRKRLWELNDNGSIQDQAIAL